MGAWGQNIAPKIVTCFGEDMFWGLGLPGIEMCARPPAKM
jgi:hypothetical protein